MKILIFSHEYPPSGGGAGVVIEQLIKELLRKTTWVIDFVTMKSECNKYAQGLNKIFEVPIHKKIWPLEYFYYFKKNIDIQSYDCIICNDSLSIYIAGMVFDKKALSKTLCFLHGSEPEYVYTQKSLGKKVLNLKYFFHRAVNYCNVIIAHGLFMKSKFENTLASNKIMLDNSKIKSAYFGFDSELFNLKDKNKNRIFIRGLYSVQADDILLVTVSRIEKKKGFKKMLDTFQSIAYGNNKVKWMIVGEGGYSRELKLLIAERKLEGKVILAGKIKRNELKKYYHAGDLFLLLSEYKEAFGLVYMEAQACGVPAVGYNNSGVKEAIINNITGFLVNDAGEVADIILKNKIKEIDTDHLEKNSFLFSASECAGNIINIIEQRLL